MDMGGGDYMGESMGGGLHDMGRSLNSTGGSRDFMGGSSQDPRRSSDFGRK